MCARTLSIKLTKYRPCSFNIKISILMSVVQILYQMFDETYRMLCVCVCVCVCVCPLRGRKDSQAGWWLSVLMQADSLMTVLTPEHTSQWAPGTLADVHTPYDTCTYMCDIWCGFLWKRHRPVKMKPKEISLCMTLEKITKRARNRRVFWPSLYCVNNKQRVLSLSLCTFTPFTPNLINKIYIDDNAQNNGKPVISNDKWNSGMFSESTCLLPALF